MKNAFFLAASALVCTVAASAHTMTWGYEDNTGGSYTVWAGAWSSHFNAPVEGYLLYTPTDSSGVSQGASTSVAFTTASSTKPAGLIDGTTNFYANPSGTMTATNLTYYIGPVSWMGVTITGITNPGYYLFKFDPVYVGGDDAELHAS